MSIYRQIISVDNSANFRVITHGLGDSAAVLAACTCGGWNGRPFITARSADDITVTFGMQAPPTGALTLDVEVQTAADDSGSPSSGSSAFGVGDYGSGLWDGTTVTEDLFEELPGGMMLPDYGTVGWGTVENENLALIDDLIARIEALEA